MDFNSLLLVAPVLLFSVIAHEIAHGYAALRQGDPTAKNLGRLTWNPLPHIDPFMTVLLPVLLILAHAPFLFGGAKPVPVDPRNYRNYKRGDIIVSLAGVATNVLIAIVCAILIVPLGLLGAAVPGAAATCSILQHMMMNGVAINLVLTAFNLLPIPPLDGSHVAKYLLPPAWALQYERAGRFGLLLLMAVFWFAEPVIDAWLTPAAVLTGFAQQAVSPFLLAATWR
ncbi:MAG TPA: site-2 protease family protein [Gemmatirosa sp.]